MRDTSISQVTIEFDRQLDNLIEKGYPAVAGRSVDDFVRLVSPLKEKLANLVVGEEDFESGYLPFVIVIKGDVVPLETAMERVEREGKPGITKLFPREPQDFQPIDGVAIPDQSAYLLVDIDRGKDNINLPPNQAMKLITDAGRSPLTIDEGIAVVTQYPEFLMKNNCFSLLASRHTTDKRVPAIWINGKKHPNLGWCWDGNPHTWLGSASCVSRLN